MCNIMERRKAYYESTYKVAFEYLLGRLDANSGCCEICGKEITFTGAKVTARVDHCHSTGEIRGILCNRCNQAIGMFGDNIEGVMRILRYLGG